MSKLTIRLLGPFEAALDGNPIIGFDSDKVRALLAYLAAESDRPHTRQALVGLLWPDMPEQSARRNLRSALANLRRVVADGEAVPPYLNITRQTLQFNTAADSSVDLHRFNAAIDGIEPKPLSHYEDLANIFRGDFLEGFSISDSARFEEWVRSEREHIQSRYLAALRHAAAEFEERGEYDSAIRLARLQLGAEPALEEAHRQAMRCLALVGQRGAALAQFENCRKALADELGVEPAPETTQLYEHIRNGEFGPEKATLRAKAIRGYELREQIGEGGFGVVYRAHQPAVAREVAIKAIRPEYANRPDFIRRFEAEAQVVARLEHPYIVPLYDYWRDPEGAYLVTRWFRAGSLQRALQRGPWKLQAAARLIDQVSQALTVAHRQGVVHRDLKPANILLDEDGNAYLTDFGIATDPIGHEETQGGSGLTGTPGYSSPEQIRDETVTQAADVYGLGVVLFELLAAEHPYPPEPIDQLLLHHLNDPMPSLSQRRSELPDSVDTVIWKATAKDPDERYATARELAEAFTQAVAPEGAKERVKVAAGVEIRNPYKGLRPFLEADAADFFGRDALVDRLVSRLSESAPEARFMAVVGPSGSGKSSVVRAGLIPALRAGAIPGSSDWFYVNMYPGNRPMEELEAALLRIAVNPPTTLLKQLESGPGGIQRAVRSILPQETDQLVLVIDQFEELFTLVGEEAERSQFIESLTGVVEDSRSNVRVIVTLRADFYDRPLQYSALGELLKTRTEVVLPLSPSELGRAISGPAESVGLEVDSELVATVTADVTEQPGALPLLQYALTELFERRADGDLTLGVYREIGGVPGAIGRRAEELYTRLDGAHKEATRQLFLRLAALGEGAEDTRRRVSQTAVRTLPGMRGAMEQVLETFGSARLLSFDRDPDSRVPTVEVAHEALLREWRRLRDWIDESREDLRLHQRLAAAASEWQEAGQDTGYLLRGTRLVQFQAWVAETDLSLSMDERRYLDQSLERAAEAQRRTTRRRRSVMAALAVAALVASVLAVFAYSASNSAQQSAVLAQEKSELAEQETTRAEEQASLAQSERNRAEMQAELAGRQARLARARELAAASVTTLTEDPELSLLLALQAVKVTHSAGEPAVGEAIEALHQSLQKSRAVLTIPAGGPADLSLDGALIITGGWPLASYIDSTPTIWDAGTGESILELPGGTADVAFSPSGRLAAVVYNAEGPVKIFRVDTGEELLSLDTPAGDFVHISPDEQFISVADYDGSSARVWNLETGEKVHEFSFEGQTGPINFSPDGSKIAIPEPLASRIHVLEFASGLELRALEHPGQVALAEFDPTGQYLATAALNPGDIRIWDTSTWLPLQSFEIVTPAVIEWSPDGNSLAAGSAGGRVSIFDLESGQEARALLGHGSGVSHLRYNAEGTRLMSSADDTVTRIWDVTPSGIGEVASFTTPNDPFYSVEYGGDGDILLTSAWNGFVRAYDSASGRQIEELSDQVVNWPMTVTVSPDGKLAATLGSDFVAAVRDIATWEVIASLPPFHWPVAISQDNSHIIVDPFGGTVSESAAIENRFCCSKLLDIATGELLLEMDRHTDSINHAAFSPDGVLFATGGSDRTVGLYDSNSMQHVVSLDMTGLVEQVSFSPDGLILAAGDVRGIVKLWDVGELKGGLNPTEALVHEFVATKGALLLLRFSVDGNELITMGFERAATFWDTDTWERLYSIDLGESTAGAGFGLSPDGERMAAAGEASIQIYSLDVNELIQIAESRVTRLLTDEECRQLLHLDSCPIES